jgi:hypothetical protein
MDSRQCNELVAAIDRCTAAIERLSRPALSEAQSRALAVLTPIGPYQEPVMINTEDGRAPNHPDFGSVLFSLEEPP